MLVDLIKLFCLLGIFLICLEVFSEKPHYIIYFTMFNVFSGIDPLLPGFSLRTYLLALLIFIDSYREIKQLNTFENYTYNRLFSKEFRWIYYFIFWALFVDVFVASMTGRVNINDLVSIITGFFKGLISWYLIIFYFQKYINSERKLHASFYIGTFSILIPIILAIMQYVGLDTAIKLATLLSNNPERVFAAMRLGQFSGNITPFFRFSYLIIPIFFLNVYFILKSESKIALLHSLILLLIFVGLMINQTRSAILGIFIGLLFTIYVTRREVFGKFAVYSLVFIVIIFAFNIDKIISSSERLNIVKYHNEQSVLKKSLSGRINLFVPSIYHIITHPIGTGRIKYREEIDDFGGLVDPKYYKLFQTTTAHNQFLTIGAYYGLPSIVLMVLLYLYFYRRLIKAVFEKKSLNILRYCLIGWLIGYIINGQVHNAYPYGAKDVALLFGMIYTLLNLQGDKIRNEQ